MLSYISNFGYQKPALLEEILITNMSIHVQKNKNCNVVTTGNHLGHWEWILQQKSWSFAWMKQFTENIMKPFF